LKTIDVKNDERLSELSDNAMDIYGAHIVNGVTKAREVINMLVDNNSISGEDVDTYERAIRGVEAVTLLTIAISAAGAFVEGSSDEVIALQAKQLSDVCDKFAKRYQQIYSLKVFEA
jgi:hypothetical protein